MSLAARIQEDLKKALKTGDAKRLSCLRMLKAALKNREVEQRRPLEQGEIESVISSLVKQGKEAAQEFQEAGRDDLALKERTEVDILYDYLPQQFSAAEIEKNLKEIIAELSAQGAKDLGRVMKTAMARMTGRAQGKEVNEIARRLLD